MRALRWFSTGNYLLLGWLVVAAISPLWASLPQGGLIWLGLGGFFYSGERVIYALKRPDPWPRRFGFHQIWHLMVPAAGSRHFWTMLAYVLPFG